MEKSKHNNIKILAVDDNAVSAEYLRKILESIGMNVDCAYDGYEAIEMIEKNSYDLVLLDHIMPGMDGISTLRLVRERGMCRKTPFIAVTGNDAEGSRENYISAGFADYVVKPFDNNTIIRTVVNILAGKNAKDVEKSFEDIPHILIVDDDLISLHVAEKILGDSFDISCVSTGVEALNFLRESVPDIILLDLYMPDLDGFSVLEQLKANKKYRDIPVVCFTSDNDRDSELKCFRLGAVDFIVKPFIAEIMRHRVTRILELNRLKNNLRQEVDKQTTELEQRTAQLQKLTKQAMKTLAGTIDAKDKYTNGHSVRVARYSREIARRLNMSEKEQEDIYYMALLHDIGKIGVPDDIINKPSTLTNQEYDVIKTHPVIGAEILKNMSALPHISMGARWHHERYDGKGYPDGLSGEEIPAIARIIGVADAYDAMTSNRSYRDALPQHIVREEIVKGRGTQFDPVLAEVMLKIIDDDENYVLRESGRNEQE